MVNVLPPKRSISSEFARSIAAGFGEGIEKSSQAREAGNRLKAENASLKEKGVDLSGITDPKMRQLYLSAALQGANAEQLEELKRHSKQEFVENIYGKTPQSENKINALKSSGEERQTAGEEIPEDFSFEQEKIEPQMTERRKFADRDIARAMIEDPNIGRAMQAQNDITIREEREDRKAKESLESEERKNRSAKEKQLFKFNEPKLAEIAGIQRKINVDNARFNRLDELFSDDSKFPSTLLTALMTKNGQLNDVAYSQLSPEAQEAVKLIIDSTSGIKDTYGARVTNFDLQTYLRKLPSLLTSPEGRRRVIRDLKGINDINEVYNEGIQEIFDKAGGSDKISFSDAERKFKKEYSSELQRKIDKFVVPEKEKFSEMPNAKKYLGKKLRNPETGEIFISDGIQWKPYEGK